jgi:hypothetical protein
MREQREADRERDQDHRPVEPIHCGRTPVVIRLVRCGVALLVHFDGRSGRAANLEVAGNADHGLALRDISCCRTDRACRRDASAPRSS